MTRIAFHPRALLVAAPLVLVLWAATDLRWSLAAAIAVVVDDALSFAGVLGARRG